MSLAATTVTEPILDHRLPSRRAPARRALRVPPPLALLGLLLGLLLAPFARPAAAAWEFGNYSPIFEPVSNAQDPAACSDGRGGMLVAIVNQDFTADRIEISRVDHTGNEIWGEGGILLPLQSGSDWQSWPIDIAPDGSGGVYCAYREGYSTHHLFAIAHVNADGTIDWRQGVDNLGIPPGGPVEPEIRLAATGNGEVIAVWTMFQPDRRLHAARFTAAGGMSWNVDVNQLYEHHYDMGTFQSATYDVAADGSGGVVVGWLRSSWPILQEQVGAQRISAGGTALWGADGHVLAAAGQIDHHEALVAGDQAGGAYVVSSLAGQAWAYHVNAGGSETWAPGGKLIQDTQTSNWIYTTQPAICGDGVGGLILVQGFEALYAQHVDVLGTLWWGPNGIVAADRAGWQETASIASDGFGGAVIGYQDHYWGSPGEDYHVLGGLRLDGFGNKLWEDPDLYMSDWGVEEPKNVQTVADGSGGVLYAWEEVDLEFGAADIYGMGVNPTGGNPVATLTYLSPESGAPGESLPVLIMGDYLEAAHTFVLQRPGSSPIPITGTAVVSPQAINGNLDLTGAALGAWDLVVSLSGAPVDTLSNALGVGEAPGCTDYHSFLTGFGGPILDESARKAAYDSEGNVHVVWIEYHSGEYRLYYRKGGPGGWAAPPLALLAVASPSQIMQPTIALDADNLRHIAAIIYVTDTHRNLFYVSYTPDGQVVAFDDLDNGQAKGHPTIVGDAFNNAHLVYEEGAAGATELYYTRHGIAGGGFAAPVNLGAGTNARQPDLALIGQNDLMLTFVRDSWVPGLTEVLYQQGHDGGAVWDTPVLLSFGVSVWSPSVASDGGDKTLFSFMLDNAPSVPLPVLHTALMEAGVLGPVKWHLDDQLISKCAVAGAGPDLFYLLTEGNAGDRIELRASDGNVLFPDRQVNALGDAHRAAFAADQGGAGLFVMWENWEPGTPMHYWDCYQGGTGVASLEAPPALGSALQAHPNPFNPATTLSIALPAAGWTRLAIYDAAGRLVRTLIDGPRAAGRQQVEWNGRDDRGAALPSGVYFSRLTSAGVAGSEVAKLTLLK